MTDRKVPGTDLNKNSRLYQKAINPHLPPAERAAAADRLDQLGYVPDDLYTFIKIPGDKHLPTFWMGKYPVTNAQYARFLKSENFADKSLWMDFPQFASPEEDYHCLESTGDAGWDWLQKSMQDEANLVEESVLYPHYWRNSRFGGQRATTPVVEVSWWEANAYARWLLTHWDELEEGQMGSAKPALIRLPREDEWTQAAGGAASGRFAFGALKNPKEEISKFCNTVENKIRRTTPVWTYPQGASPHGVMDMSGNVWEWQGNYHNKFHDIQSLHGGSWGDVSLLAQVTYRLNGSDLHYWLISIGFRLVSPPVTRP